MISIIARLLRLRSEESLLVRDFHKGKVGAVDKLTEFYAKRCKPFKNVFGLYISPSGHATVCDDIYGYEVKIVPNRELLDCVPSAYGLRKSQGMALYDAILSNVPGTINYIERYNLGEPK